MARKYKKDYSWDELKSLARQIREVADRVDQVATTGKRAGMTSLVSPGHAIENTHLPKTVDWSRKLQLDLEIQIDAFKREQEREKAGRKKAAPKAKAKAKKKATK